MGNDSWNFTEHFTYSYSYQKDSSIYQVCDDGTLFVDSYKKIPMDYDKEMRVPISFMDKYNPKQFELIRIIRPTINGKEKFSGFLIKKK